MWATTINKEKKDFTLAGSSYLHDWKLLVSSSHIKDGIHLCLDFCLFLDSHMIVVAGSWDLWCSRWLWSFQLLLISPMGQGCIMPGALVAFLAPFLTFVTLKHVSTIVDWQGIGLNLGRLVVRSRILGWPTEMRPNIPTLQTIVITNRLLDYKGSWLGLTT